MRSPRTLPARLLAPVIAFGLLAAACGDDITEDGTESTADSTADSTAGSTADSTAGSTADSTGDSASVKPTVELPDVLPTELVITDLTTGTGPQAAAGDTVVVNYVGVRSEDGTEFDNSYDRGSPFSVTLGSNSVIQGWEQGLLGMQQGGRRQLDIPADLAYGDAPQGDVIQPGDALSFVVDAVAVLAATDPADEPAIEIEGGANVDSVVVEDLVAGSGEPIQLGQSAAMHLIAYRADTGEKIQSSWEQGVLQPIIYEAGQTLDGLFDGMEGITVGTRRQITIPFALAWGAEGNVEFGLPAETDVVIVVDVFAIY